MEIVQHAFSQQVDVIAPSKGESLPEFHVYEFRLHLIFFLLHVICLERKLRIKRAITVPALSNKPADIPPDDYSWRKYGQKPIKGSPHPRYVHVSYSFLSLNQIFFSACKSYWSGMYCLR